MSYADKPTGATRLSQADRLRLVDLLGEVGWTRFGAIIGTNGPANAPHYAKVMQGLDVGEEEVACILGALAEYEGKAAHPAEPDDGVGNPGAADKPPASTVTPETTSVSPARRKGAPDVLLQRSFEYKALSFNLEARTVDVICSTDTIDAYGDSVEQVWDLKRFNANPVVLFCHDSRAMPLGSCIGTCVKKVAGRDALVSTIRFASAKVNPLAEQCLHGFAEGVLRAVSVGFIPRTVRYEMRDGKEICVLSQNELFELSVTPTPANPDALARDTSAVPVESAEHIAQRKRIDQMVADEMRAIEAREKAVEKELEKYRAEREEQFKTAALAESAGKAAAADEREIVRLIKERSARILAGDDPAEYERDAKAHATSLFSA